MVNKIVIPSKDTGRAQGPGEMDEFYYVPIN